MTKEDFQKLFLRMFYGFWLIVWTYSIYEPLVFDRTIGTRFIYQILWPHMNAVSYHSGLIFCASFILPPLIFPMKTWARICGFIGIFGASTFALEYGSSWSYLNMWIYSSLWFVFAGKGWFTFERALLTIQFHWCTIMLVAATHKILILFEPGNDLSFTQITQYTTAYVLMLKTSISPTAMLFMESSALAGVAWLSGIALELIIFFLFLFSRHKVLTGVLSVIFNLANMLTFRVYYMDTAICLIIVFVVGAFYLKAQKQTLVLRLNGFRPEFKYEL